MDRQEILLKEYETCQSYTNYLGTQFWVGISIFMTINVAVLGGATYSIIASNAMLPKNTQWLILLLGLGVIVFSLLMRGWQQRNQFIAVVNFARMQEIENEIGMERNWRIHGLDLKYKEGGLSKLNKKRRRWIYKISQNYKPMKWWHSWIPLFFPKPHQYVFRKPWIIDWIYIVVILIWITIILMSFFMFDY